MTNSNLRVLRGKFAHRGLLSLNVIAIALIALINLTTSNAAFAANECKGTIQRILVQGNQRIEASTVISYTVL